VQLEHEPHHDGSPAYLSPSGGRPGTAPSLGERVTVRLLVPHASGFDTVFVRTTPDAEPTYRPARKVATLAAVDLWDAEVEVVNPVSPYRFLCEGPGGSGWVSQIGFTEHDIPDTWDFRLLASPPPPEWVADAVLYQIFPDRFARAAASEQWPEWAERAGWDDPVAREHPASMRQLYGGDLPGITAHLDHLVDLGVTGIYLNPVFPAPENHRYCASSFDHVDPFLGGDAALAELSRELHDRGLRLLGDLTLNHSGDTHEWFRRAQADPSSIEAGFYHFIEHPDRYEAWVGVPSLPKFDLRSPELARRLYDGADSLAARWLRAPFHLDGWRVDAANVAGRRGALDSSHELQRQLLATVRSENPDAYVLAEHCHDATADLQGAGWHGTMDYTGFTRPVWSWLRDPEVELGLIGPPIAVPRRSARSAVRTMRLVHGQLPWRSVVHSMVPLGSHDTARWAEVAGDRARRHVGLAWQLTFPGVPSLFYGDEIGLRGASDDLARAPMPWGHPERWDTATLGWTRRLIALRRSSVALRQGGLRWLHVGDDELVYLRDHPEERILVHLARGTSPAVDLDAGALPAEDAEALLDHDDLLAVDRRLRLPATSGATTRIWRLSSLGGAPSDPVSGPDR
jgi:alpha-glucosidase